MRIPLLIAFFCAAGGVSRYYFAGYIHSSFGASFPFGTLAVNILGAYLIGLLMEIGTQSSGISEPLRIALTTGFLGGLTTFSTFSYESFRLIEDGRISAALANIVVSVAASLIFTWLGIFTARTVL